MLTCAPFSSLFSALIILPILSCHLTGSVVFLFQFECSNELIPSLAAIIHSNALFIVSRRNKALVFSNSRATEIHFPIIKLIFKCTKRTQHEMSLLVSMKQLHILDSN